MSTTEPVAPPPTRRKPAKVTAPPADNMPANLAEAAAAPASTREVVRTEQPPAADPLEALGRAMGAAQGAQGAVGALTLLMGLGRPVDPENDLTAGPNRYPKYIIAALTLIKNSTGQPLQQIVADALTGKAPIPAAVLDEAFRAIYGYDRPPVR